MFSVPGPNVIVLGNFLTAKFRDCRRLAGDWKWGQGQGMRKGDPSLNRGSGLSG